MKTKGQCSIGGRLAVKQILRRSINVSRFSKFLTVAMVVFTSLVSIACNGGQTNGDSEAAARVGSRDITMKQVDSAIKQQMDQAGGAIQLTSAELVTARLTTLEKLIQEEALYQKAQKDNLVPDDNKVNQEVARRKQEARVTEDQWQEQLKRAGLTETDVRDQVRRGLAINELLEKEKSRVTAPTDSEIEKYYNDNKSALVLQAGMDISMITTDPVDNGLADDAKSPTEAENKIKAIYELLRGGTTDFATLA